jgi:FixJ family two-component response regulator
MGLGERFLPKPVDKKTLIQAITEAIEKSRL